MESVTFLGAKSEWWSAYLAPETNCLLYRYGNMDFILFSGVKQCFSGGNRRMVISYDIGCQWSRNLEKRMQQYPPSISLPSDTDLVVGVPKFHLAGHGKKCQTRYSFNYLPGSGRTCGELVETDWGVNNAVGPSTREMSSWARQEVLNDHWGHWNWRKIVKLGELYFYSPLVRLSAHYLI
jgi:hypothetical protein